MSTTRTAILGSGGMLGTSWSRTLPGAIGFAHPDFDLTDPAAVDRLTGFDLVINAAAFTDVDGAEAREAEATELNGAAVGRLAARCKEIGATLVHYSTDYIFDGAGETPYPTDHERAPRSAYGRSKLAGELALEASGADFLCIRTSWLYAAHGKNFVKTIARLCAEKDRLRVVDDQRGRPTSADQLVLTTQALLNGGARGFFHGSDSGECTWFEFAGAIGERVNPACVIEPCATDEFPRDAERPAYSVLDLSKTEAIVGETPHWRASLDRVLDTLLTAAPDAPRKAC